MHDVYHHTCFLHWYIYLPRIPVCWRGCRPRSLQTVYIRISTAIIPPTTKFLISSTIFTIPLVIIDIDCCECHVVVVLHGVLWKNKMKNKTYHTVEVQLQYQRSNSIPLTQIHGRSLSWLGTGTSIKCERVKLILMAQTFPFNETMRLHKCFSHVSKMSTLPYIRLNNVIIKNDIILNIIHIIYLIFVTQKMSYI